MSDKHNGDERYTFGPWLATMIKNQGMTQKEFADKVGVGQGSVSRWVKWRAPQAKYIRPIANALMVDYDLVNTKAGYRPRDLDRRITDPDSAESQILYVAQHVTWTPERLSSVLSLLRSLAQVSREEAKREREEVEHGAKA